jgi:hypothetical protein
MPNNSLTQQELARSPHFHKRVGAALSTVAWQVLNEAEDVPGHTTRANYARAVLDFVSQKAQQIAPWLAERPNLIAFETSYDFSAAAVVTAAGDADIESQLMTDWDDMAGVTPEPPEARR